MVADRPLFRIDTARHAATVARLRAGLADEPGLQYAYLFGSFLEGGAFHDIDVALAYVEMPAAEADRRAFDVAERLEPSLRLPLDVVALNGRPVSFRFHVYRGLALVVCDEEALTGDIERTAQLYFDQEHLLRQATVEAFAS